MRRAFSDLTVVQLSGGVAGSYCAKVFADLGADVVRVARPDDEAASARTGSFLHLNTNKRQAVLDPAQGEAGRLRDLLDTADLVVEEPGAGSLAGWGSSYDELRTRRPACVVVHISGFGLDGPYADYKAADLIVQAMGGAMLLVGTEQVPLRLPGQLGPCFTGSMAAVGALGAVTLARTTGRGSRVDCAAVEVLSSVPSRATMLLSHQYRGGSESTSAGARSGATLIPTGVFPCADGYMAMMSTPQQLREMLDVLDDDNLRAAFAEPDAFDRADTKEAIDAALYPWLFSHTRAEATAAAQEVGWPLTGVNSPQEVLAAEHLHQRGFWTHVDDPVVGSIDLPGAPYRLAEGGWALRRLAPLPPGGAGPSSPERADDLRPAAAEVGPPRRARPPIRTGNRAGSRGLPLEGVRVLDLTTVWSGPYATMLLADLGAEVIRVENPWVLPPTTKGYQARPVISDLGLLGSGYGPAAPGRPDRPWNRHALNNSTARNKLSCTIDTRRPEGRELLMRLAEQSDVFIENFKASGLGRIGIEVSALRERNPRLVVVRLPPTGLSGDWSSYTGFGTQFDGLTGLLWICGHRGSDLTTSPATTYMDAATGPAAAFATMAALRYRDETGRGQVVELSQSENVLNHLGDIYVDAQLGREPERMGNRDRWRAPQGVYAGRGDNRWLALSVGDDDEWAALAKVMDRPELGADPRFTGAAQRRAHHDEIDLMIERWMAAQDVTDAFVALQQAGVPAAPVMDEAMFSHDAHIQARRFMRPMQVRDVGTHPHPGQPYRGVPQAWRRGSPALGEDNEYVYKELLGVDDEEFARLAATGMLADDYLDSNGNPY